MAPLMNPVFPHSEGAETNQKRINETGSEEITSFGDITDSADIGDITDGVDSVDIEEDVPNQDLPFPEDWYTHNIKTTN